MPPLFALPPKKYSRGMLISVRKITFVLATKKLGFLLTFFLHMLYHMLYKTT